MVIEAVIPGKFLARTALVQRSTREQAARSVAASPLDQRSA
jgi:hypothetical protein